MVPRSGQIGKRFIDAHAQRPPRQRLRSYRLTAEVMVQLMAFETRLCSRVFTSANRFSESLCNASRELRAAARRGWNARIDAGARLLQAAEVIGEQPPGGEAASSKGVAQRRA